MIPAVVAGEIRETLLDYLRTTWSLSDREVERALFAFLTGERGIFQGPYVRLRLPFEPAPEGVVAPLDIEAGYTPYRHQLEAWKRLSTRDGHEPQPTLVVTGTGSGKTEAFLMPILDHCLRARQRGERGIKAIILYPMNALAADQARRIAETIWKSGGERGMQGRLDVGMYVGGEGSHRMMGPDHVIDVDKQLRLDPPDILLTNYKMLDFLLLRPKDRDLWKRNGPETLRYLVLDELHTYDGAQGTDVACLIRRLDARLGGRRTFCPVGTSATVTGEGGRDDRKLLELATAIFGREFPGDAVIGESRRSPASFFELFAHPLPGKLPEETEGLEPGPADDIEGYVGRVARAWFPEATRLGGEGEPVPRAVLGDLVARHPTARALIEVASERLFGVEALGRALAERDAAFGARDEADRRRLLGSLLAMLSWAQHAQARDMVRPLVSVQVQLWVREVRRLVREVALEPRFAWRDEEPDRVKEPLALPMYACRACGHSGWISVRNEIGGTLERDAGRIGRAAMQRDPDVIYLHHDRYAAPEGELPGMGERVCVRCARVGREQTCRHCKEEAVPVFVHQARSAQVPQRDLQRCPACGTDFALGILASRAATLSSVAVGHLYTTPFNSDQKLLAFSDSVQDASHRAGFFAGRTYRFTLRSAMLAVVPEDGSPVALSAVAPAMIERFEGDGEPGDMVAAFMPRDLEYLDVYQKHMEAIEKAREAKKAAPATPKKLREVLETRLRWEVTRELGLAARIGRTLERTGCASVGVDGEAFDAALAELPERMRARFGVLDDVAAERWRAFVAGLVHRVRLRGGVYDGLLQKYFTRKGHGSYLTKREAPLLSPFGARTSRPIFLTDEAEPDRFDTVQPSRDNWYVDWARRALGAPLALRDAKDLYRAVLPALAAAGLLVEHAAKGHRAWALLPEALVVSRRVRRLECGECGAEHVEVAGDRSSLEGAACARYRCGGTLAAVAEDPEEARARSYYRRFYQSPRLGRVYASEHTGLLERPVREKLEASFKDRHRPDAPNMLSCTPTLEMGIDIGDLSSTMLVSVPPTAASYLQRIGRAGRKTGNALVLQITTTRPHDLYFFDDPEAVMAGPVQPPGCHLDAPEILKRHALAWCLDAWAKEAEGRSALPVSVKELFQGDPAHTFPAPFFAFVSQRRDVLRAGFLRAFPVSESTKNELERFFEGAGPGASELERRLSTTVEALGSERDALRKHYRYVADRIKALEAEPHKSDDYEEERRELLSEKDYLDKELWAFHRQYLLELLCERGLLPNYAFPEDGVKLRAFVAGDDAGGGERFAVVRAAQTAIRELAPFNTFYGMARKVRVDSIEVGARRGPGRGGLLETWQLCAQCGHMEPHRSKGMSATCPRCQAEDWLDQGRRRVMVRLDNVFAFARQRDAAFSDESEDRDRESYVSEVWLDPDPADAKDAWLNREAKFGFELLPKLVLREVNFGRDRIGVPDQTVGGRELPHVAFDVCRECGQVREEDPQQRRRRRGPLHRPWCTSRHKPDDRQPWAQIHLYREITSEALRLVLPVSMLDPEVQLPNARAALELGMRRYFGGDPDHLRVTLHDEPTFLAEGARRRYLVVHDTVPGGTGVLAELAAHRGAKLRRVLEEAREAVTSCPCRARGPEVRACYRCLYAYRRQDDLSVLDRDVAGRLVGRWLGAFDGLGPVDTISVLEMASILESELEHRFVGRLRDWAERRDDVTMAEEAHERWRLTVGGRVWRLEPQVVLDQGHDVAIPCRPDFVLWPEGHDGLPVALFADGASYHVKPGAPRGRIGDDFEKRQAILRSGRFRVWSFAWQDLDVFHGGAADDVPPFVEREEVRRDAERVAAAAGGDAAVAAVRAGLGADPLTSLVAYLRDPSPKRWGAAATVAAVALLSKLGRPGDLAGVERVAESLRSSEEPGAALVDAGDGGAHWAAVGLGGSPGARLLVHGEAGAIGRALAEPGVLRAVLRLDDTEAQRAHASFPIHWRAFLRATAFFQFLPGLEIATTEQLLPSIDVEDLVEPTPRVARVAEAVGRPLDDAVREEIESLEDATVREVLTRLLAEGVPVPDIPLVEGDGEAVLDARILLGWPAEWVGVYEAGEEDAAERLRDRGWTLFAAGESLDADALRRALGRES